MAPSPTLLTAGHSVSMSLSLSLFSLSLACCRYVYNANAWASHQNSSKNASSLRTSVVRPLRIGGGLSSSPPSAPSAPLAGGLVPPPLVPFAALLGFDHETRKPCALFGETERRKKNQKRHPKPVFFFSDVIQRAHHIFLPCVFEEEPVELRKKTKRPWVGKISRSRQHSRQQASRISFAVLCAVTTWNGARTTSARKSYLHPTEPPC